ncbi:MAG TPA: glycosyltransferase [Azonexus sp.]
MSLQVSVVVPTYRRPEMLRRCLRALLGQHPAPAGCEVIVVDDGRADSIRHLLDELASELGPAGVCCELRYLRPPPLHRGPAAARNAGWRAARAAIIAFTDDDTIPAPDWLVSGLAAMAESDTAAAWGEVVVPLRTQPTDAERNIAGLSGAEFVTANCFVRYAALLRAGGFDERFERPWREDSDLYFTLLENGEKVVRAPRALVIHPARRAGAAYCLRLHRNLYFEALLFKKHRRLYREKIAAAPPLRYYLAVLLLLAVPAALLAGMPGWALAAALGWLALTVQFARRRLRGLSREWNERLGVAVTSALIPPLAVFWRLAGAWHFRVAFA